MRATSTLSPVRHGRHRLLESCAIAASLIALAHAGPAAAQVAGSGTITTLPSGTTSNTGANPSTVNVSGSQSIITWTPSNTPVDGVIDFLPAANGLDFVGGTAGYIVLNRFTSASGASITDQIALNGRINSYIGSTSGPRGGNIWFYNAGGILVGGGAAINVGSLVLTANAIDTTGGLLGPGGEIRFRGAASTSTVEIAQTATINALTPGNPGGSYVALVAPRIVQRGTVTTDGSTAYVAAEQADITINNGLFDINVTVGAADGDVITHTGVTTGPAHQQDDIDQNRIYMVAIPKNDAVTMLVSGQIGYDDAASAQIDPDGAVRLSAGYNIVDGEFADAPVAGGTGNITVNDTLFRNDVVAHASGAFVGRPISEIPPPIFDTPDVAHVGRISVEGNATFIGDASTAITVDANRFVGATGNLVVQSGIAGTAGVTTVTVNGGQIGTSGDLSILANGVADAAGDAAGGSASLTVSNGGAVNAIGDLTVAANGVGADGGVGSGSGGTAAITVTGAGSSLTGSVVAAQANGFAGVLIADAGGGITPPDQAGSGTGGSATVNVQDGGALTSTDGSVSASADGAGQIGNIQSGNGTGGTARIEIAGANSALNVASTVISATGTGGGTISDPVIGTFFSAAGGDGRGGSATFSIGGDASTAINAGDTSLTVTGRGGDAGGAENASGGNAFGGTATVEGSGPVAVTFPSLTVNADAIGGGASSPSALTALTGNATGGTINITADNGAALNVDSSLPLTAEGLVAFGENLGSGRGGNVTVSAEDEGAIDVAGGVVIDVSGGGFGNSITQSAGSGTGGNVNLLAARGGTLTAAQYDVNASGQTANVFGANGPAQGGFVNVEATAGGQIAGADISLGTIIDASALGGVSADGSVAGGGTIQLTAGGGGITFNATTILLAAGVSGGATNPGSSTIGNGGVIQIQVLADPTTPSSITFDTLLGGADGLTAVDVEAAPGIEQSAGDGQGGTMTIGVAGGSFTANTINVTADGYGGGVGTASGVGRGGTASYTQTGGTVTVGDMAISANGFGGFAPDVAGQGLGGNASIDLLGGTLTGGNIVAMAVGGGGAGATGNDFDPAATVPSGNGGEGQGGTATITIDGATVDAGTLAANAFGSGGTGGVFVSSSFGDPPGNGGDGGTGLGGTATINVVTDTVTAGGIIADAAGIGGEGGNVFASSSSGVPFGVGVGGDGGEGRGGSATIDFASTVTVSGDITSAAAGIGGNGGGGLSGGNGGLGTGGLAQAIVTGFDAGTLAVTVDSSAFGGTGADGSNGVGGNGGDARGGTARIAATGPGASATVGQANFVTGGTGGDGGSGAIPFGATPEVAPRGGDGGTGEGGTLEVVASGGATVALGPDTSGAVALASRGTGGDAGNGSDAAFPDGSQGGDGGNGGGAIGGTVHLVANGGTITSNGNPVDITVDGTAGISGSGGVGTGTGAPGAGGSSNGTTGGRVILESFGTPAQPGQIGFGDTAIAANGDSAGRIGIYASGGNIAMTSLTAEALGAAPLTNLDTDVANTGIFFGLGGGSVTTTGAVSLTTGSSIGVYAQAGGTLAAGGDLSMQAADEIDIRHDFRTGTAPTIASGGAMSVTAASSVRAQPGSLLSAATSLLVNTTASNGSVNVDALEAGTLTLILAENFARVGSTTSGDDLTVNAFGIEIGSANAGDDINLNGNMLTLGTLTTDGSGLDSEIDGSNIFLGSAAATTVTHAEADNDFIADVGSFQTGLNSIITGGDIIITSPGAVDLGNSTAGGFVSVDGQSIAFNAINAGSTVGLTATGTASGADGISGVAIDAGSGVDLNATRIAISGTVASGGSIFASGSAGPVTIGTANADDFISIGSAGDINGAYNGFSGVSLNAGGDVVGSASATGFESSSSGTPIAASVFVDAGGDVTLTSGNAAGMYGVNAGGGATLTGVSADEDLFIRAGTTANLTNLTAGDDLTAQAAGTITAAGLLTTGAGPDNQSIDYSTGFDVVTSSADGSNIGLVSTGGNVAANSANAFDNLTVNAAGTLSSTGLLRSGLATSLTGNLVNVTAVTAGTDIGVNSASGVTATGALAAGHDVTVGTAGNVDIAELDAGDDITVDAGGTVRIGAAYSYGTGLDNEGDGNIAVTAGGALTFACIAQSAGNVTLQGPSVSTAAIDAVGDVGITATAGDIVANGDVAGFRIAFDAAGNIDHAAGSSLDAGFTLRLDAGGDIATGAASSAGDMTFTTGGAISSGALTSARNILLSAGGPLTLAGDANAGLALRIEASEVELGAIAVNANELSITATSGGVHSTGAVNVNGPVTVLGAGAVEMTGDMIVPSAVYLRGTSVTVGNVTGADSVSLIANAGAVNSAGTIEAGRNIFISTTDGGSFNRLIAGDDIGINGSGDIDIAFMDATGDNPEGEEIGSNVGINLTTGNVFVGHGEAADDYLVNATSFRTGLNSIIAGGNIEITTAGASDLGNSTAGGSITVDAQSIAFNTLDAGTTVSLTANGAGAGASDIAGTNIAGGSHVRLVSDGGIQLGGNVISDAGNILLSAQSDVSVNNLEAAGYVSVSADGDGVFTALGTLRAGDFISILGRRGITANRLIADGAVSLASSGDVRAVSMDAGTGILINMTGNLVIERAEANTYFILAKNFTPNVTTQIGSLTAGTFIEIGGLLDVGPGGRLDLGSVSAGTSIEIDAQSVTFDSMTAGTTLDLVSVEAINGTTIAGGGNIGLTGNSIAITGSVTGDAGLAANATGGAAAISNADLAGNIAVVAAGNLTGTYISGSSIVLDSAANITASATANGGDLFVDAAGNATLTNSGAASMFGVNAGQATSVTGGTAGEDLLVLAGTTANLSNVTAGDDVTVRANGAITAQGVSATGAGTDSRALSFTPANGFTISSGEGTSASDGADIVMASASGAIGAGGLSAGDDILLTAATALTLDGATTLGLGITGGDSSIRTQSASAVLGGLAAASDVVVDASGAVAVDSPSTAGRDVLIDAASANIASLTNPAGEPADTLAAGRDLSIATPGAIAGGAMRAGRDLTLSAGSTIDIARAATGAGGSLSLDAAAGITAAALTGGGATSLTSGNGAILVGNLASAGPVTAIGNSVTIDGSGNLIFSQVQTDTGDARITTGGNLAFTTGTVAGEARLSAGGNLAVSQLDAGNAILASNGTMTLGNVTADDILAATAQSLLTVNGTVTGRAMSLASADIAITSAGRVGTGGTTESLELRNIDDRAQTFIGGTGTPNGYHIDSDELTRVYGTDIRIFAPAVDRSINRFIGTAPPDVVIDDFTMAAGSSTSNLGANGSLTIETPGTARVVGDVALTGMGDNNALNILADQSLEVILGDGSIRLSGSSSTAPAGQLNLVSEDVIVATLAAIDDVAAASSTDAIEDRLAQNDGITSDDGALVAGGINVGVSGGFYVQNSGGSDFGERRGLTFGALGLNVDTAGPDTRIVINGVHLGPSGQVTGLDTIPLLTINGVASGTAPADAFDQRSRFNGCLIANTGACATVPEPEYHNSFPVQDVIEEEVDDDGDDGVTLAQSLITMRDLDPLTGEPLLDDPVTGAGNDDLWTPPTD